MLHVGESKEQISRRSFLKLGFGGILVTAVPLLLGCLGGDEGDEEDEEDD